MGETIPLQSNAPGTEQVAMTPPSAPPSQVAERLRVKELLRYFQPPNLTINKEKPQVALDTSLTAYAQLSALKVGCQRSFISLIDHETQYIIAEATRTISLETGETDAGADDAIYLGATNLDIFWGVCPHTISVFTASDNSLNITAPYVKANRSYYIMNDLSKVPGYETRPYIVGWPHMRYYAEVPIHSPSGLVIGSLCVVDNKPREGVDMKGIAILKEISQVIMDHLELVMSKVQRTRAERMIHGLGVFIEGSGSMRERWIDSEKNSRTVDPSKRRLTLDERADKEFGVQEGLKINTSRTTNIEFNKARKEIETSDPDVFKETTPLYLQQSSINLLDTLSSSPPTESISTGLPRSSTFGEDRMTESNTNTMTNESIQKDSPGWQSLGIQPVRTNSSVQDQVQPQSELELMLSRAANLIREAVNFSGVVFFDPQVRASGHANYSSSLEGLDTDKDTRSTTSFDGHRRPDQELLKNKNQTYKFAAASELSKETPCKVLARSTHVDTDKEENNMLSLDLPKRILEYLVDKFPQGGILEYDDTGPVNHSELKLSWYKNIPKGRDYVPSANVLQNYSSNSGGSDSKEARYLSHMLSGVRSIVLFPLWDSRRDRLFTYNIAWTTDQNRVFQKEDFAYLASFCNSINSELSRLDTVAADRAKTNFISSISHELRSPLHGVLASAELLKTLTSNTTSVDIINTIETCGSTLLDTMENLLTHTKINDIIVTQQQRISTANLSSRHEIVQQSLLGLTDEIDLGYLVEEVINASISGHQFRKSLEAPLIHNWRIDAITDSSNIEDSITVICDIDPQAKWIFLSQAGVWKRILMNLLGNSLKYTAAGFIHVRLSQEDEMTVPHESSKNLVCLTVEDSGKGISDEYMKNNLFQPFQQEDPLCAGTGLGLSIVHQLVASMNGTIDVQSEVGYGTKIMVKAILESLPETESHDLKRKPSREVLSKLTAHKVGLVALDVYPDIQETPTGILSKQAKRSLLIKSSLTRTLEKTFSLRTVTIASLDSNFEDIDILLTTESHFQTCKSASSRPRTLPLIILCSKLTLDYRSVSHISGPIIYLSQPFGPRRIARALEACIPFLEAKTAMGNPLSRPLPIHVAITPESEDFQQDLVTSPLSSIVSIDVKSENLSKRRERPQVLLVEDNPINLKLLVTFLEKLGYPCVTAMDGLQAVEKYENAPGKFDIIFMDIQMPKMDGMVASYEIRKFEQQNKLNRTPIVALTGLASVAVQEEAILSGIDLFLTKPVPLKRLKAVLEDQFPLPE